MTKVVCVNKRSSFSLPDRVVYEGNVYESKNSRLYSSYFGISKDGVYLGLFRSKDFITLAEFREQQMKNILDD
jgi:hypothetical protein